MPENWNWQLEGFKLPPLDVRSTPGLRLYRAWGGAASLRGNPGRPGVCFSLDRPGSRQEAEKLFAVFEWGNNCFSLSEFLVPPDTTLWVGEADPGDPRAVLGGFFGSQVFIANPEAQTLIVVKTVPLRDDLHNDWVLPGRSGRA